MEIRCKNCEHVGEAAEVRALPGGVGLVCAQCAHVNLLHLEDGQKSQKVAANLGQSSREKTAVVDEISAEDVQGVRYLVPQAGDGPRCPKCLALIGENHEHCARCGLKLTEIERFGPGNAPWERAPAGKQAEFERAEQIWRSISGDVSQAGFDEWVGYVQAQDLLDYGVRKLQLQLIETREDPRVLEALARIEKKLQQRVFVATTEAELSAKAYSGVVARLRQRLLAFSLVFWVCILGLFAVVFWGKC